MNYVNLGKTGLKVSRICLGCMSYGAPATGNLKPGSHAWALNEDESGPFFRQAIELGINFFDTVNVYSGGASEEVLGRFLKANVRREAVVIATKVHGVNARRPQRPWSLSQSHLLRTRPEPPPSADRLCRPLPDSPLGLRNPDRRSSRGAARCGEIRQGALHRRLVHVCVAIHQSAVSRRPSRLDPSRYHAESLQPALLRRRVRDDPPFASLRVEAYGEEKPVGEEKPYEIEKMDAYRTRRRAGD